MKIIKFMWMRRFALLGALLFAAAAVNPLVL